MTKTEEVIIIIRKKEVEVEVEIKIEIRAIKKIKKIRERGIIVHIKNLNLKKERIRLIPMIIKKKKKKKLGKSKLD